MIAQSHPLLRLLFLSLGVSIWAGALFGATQMHQFSLPLGHGICGPWGCAAEPEALLGYHLMLATLLAPAVALVCRWLDPHSARQLGRWTLRIGLLGAAALAAWGTSAWLADGSAPQYALQRGLFVVATTPDLPVLPLILAGLAGLTAARPIKNGDLAEPTANEPTGDFAEAVR